MISIGYKRNILAVCGYIDGKVVVKKVTKRAFTKATLVEALLVAFNNVLGVMKNYKSTIVVESDNKNLLRLLQSDYSIENGVDIELVYEILFGINTTDIDLIYKQAKTPLANAYCKDAYLDKIKLNRTSDLLDESEE